MHDNATEKNFPLKEMCRYMRTRPSPSEPVGDVVTGEGMIDPDGSHQGDHGARFTGVRPRSRAYRGIMMVLHAVGFMKQKSRRQARDVAGTIIETPATF